MSTWYIRTSGSDNNGGSSASTTPDQQGTDGSSVASTTFTSAGATFTAGDVGKGINVAGAIYRVITRISNTQITVDRNLANASGQTWKLGGALATIGKSLTAASTAILGGDTIYIGGGTYRETVIITLTPTSNLNVIGDVDGSNTGDAGKVIWTAYTTNDTTTVSASVTCKLNGKSNYTFKYLEIVGGSGSISCVDATTNTSQGIVFSYCSFVGISNAAMIKLTPAIDTALNFTFDSCVFLQAASGGSYCIYVSAASTTTGGWSVNGLIQNCLFLGTSVAIGVDSVDAAHTGRIGGVNVYNCSFIGNQRAVQTGATQATSTTFPVNVYNSVILAPSTGQPLAAQATGQIIENYNLITGTRSNVSTGANSKAMSSFAPRLSAGFEIIVGMEPRPPFTPEPASPLLGAGGQGGGPSVDALGFNRPSGGQIVASMGWVERANTAVVASGTTYTLTGPGTQEFEVPVPAAATTIAITLAYDGNYGAGTKPQLQLVADGQIGVTVQTQTMSAVGAGVNATLTLTFTPTASGIARVRIISQAAATNAVVTMTLPVVSTP